MCMLAVKQDFRQSASSSQYPWPAMRGSPLTLVPNADGFAKLKTRAQHSASCRECRKLPCSMSTMFSTAYCHPQGLRTNQMPKLLGSSAMSALMPPKI
jgi:hypothetical protein